MPELRPQEKQERGEHNGETESAIACDKTKSTQIVHAVAGKTLQGRSRPRAILEVPRNEQSETVAPVRRIALPKQYAPGVCVLQQVGQQVTNQGKATDTWKTNRDGPIRAVPGPLLGPHLDAEPACSGNIVQRVSTCFDVQTRDDDLGEGTQDRTWMQSQAAASCTIAQNVTNCFACLKHWSQRGRDDDPTVNRNEKTAQTKLRT